MVKEVRGESFQLVRRGGLTWLECASLARLPWLVHAFSTRLVTPRSRAAVSGLDLSLSHHFAAGAGEWRLGGRRRAALEGNRKRFLTQVGAEAFSLALLRQVHSSTAFEVGWTASGKLRYDLAGCSAKSPLLGQSAKERVGVLSGEGPGAHDEPRAGDALLTDEPGILLSVRTADCLPILIADPRRRAVAAVHAGWRGALQRIAEKAVGEMRRAFGSNPGDLLAAVGPGIRVCCYQVGQEVVDAFRGRFPACEGFFQARPRDEAARRATPRLWLSINPPGHGRESAQATHLDLVAVVRSQLESAGVRGSHIAVADFCTACRTDLFYSYRKEGSQAGRAMGVIGIRAGTGTRRRSRRPSSRRRRRTCR